MTQRDIELGRVILVVGLTPPKPAEFVIIQLHQHNGAATKPAPTLGSY